MTEGRHEAKVACAAHEERKLVIVMVAMSMCAELDKRGRVHPRHHLPELTWDYQRTSDGRRKLRGHTPRHCGSFANKNAAGCVRLRFELQWADDQYKTSLEVAECIAIGPEITACAEQGWCCSPNCDAESSDPQKNLEAEADSKGLVGASHSSLHKAYSTSKRREESEDVRREPHRALITT